MRIHFDNVDFNSNSGPNSFAKRLANQLVVMGHEIAANNYDVFISFIEKRGIAESRAKKIHRLDGIWFKPENFVQNNKRIKDAYCSADAVIIQSQFDKRMAQKYFGERDNVFVINNGIKFKKYDRIKELDHNSEMIFVCSASWHPQKRLKENILLFQHIRKHIAEKGKNARLYVLGRGANFSELSQIDLDNVFYLNHQSHETCLRLYATADYFLHMAWLDHCPNVVVEALSQGCPVICNNSGGTHEIVKGNGCIIEESKEYNLELLDYDSPYSIDFSGFVLPDKKPEISCDYLNIEKVAERYLEVFKNNVT